MKNGQALVAVLMALSVLVTVGLSVVSRSVTEVSVTTTQQESAKALEAAEAGLEKAVGGTITGGSGSLSGSGASFVVTPIPALAIFTDYVIPYSSVEGMIASVDMNGYTLPGIGTTVEKRRLYFCWGLSSNNPVLALEATLYYVDPDGKLKMGRRVYNPNNAIVNLPSSIASSFTDPPNLNQCPKNFRYAVEEHFSEFMRPVGYYNDNGMKILRFKLYGSMPGGAEQIAITTKGKFVRQGAEFVSVGAAGSATQRIRGINLNYDVPSVFDTAVFSGTSLDK